MSNVPPDFFLTDHDFLLAKTGDQVETVRIAEEPNWADLQAQLTASSRRRKLAVDEIVPHRSILPCTGVWFPLLVSGFPILVDPPLVSLFHRVELGGGPAAHEQYGAS
jgi:hypothetical protein